MQHLGAPLPVGSPKYLYLQCFESVVDALIIFTYREENIMGLLNIILVMAPTRLGPAAIAQDVCTGDLEDIIQYYEYMH